MTTGWQQFFSALKQVLTPVAATALGALVGLLLIRPEARLLHAQVTGLKSFFMSHYSIRCGCNLM